MFNNSLTADWNWASAEIERRVHAGRSRGNGRHDSRHSRHFGFLTLVGGDTVGDTTIGFDTAQQLHAGVQEIIDLTLVIPLLALALGEHGIGNRLRGDLVESLHILFGDAVDAQLRRALVHDPIGELIDLLAVIGRHMRLAGAEPLAIRATDVTGDVMI